MAGDPKNAYNMLQKDQPKLSSTIGPLPSREKMQMTPHTRHLRAQSYKYSAIITSLESTFYRQAIFQSSSISVYDCRVLSRLANELLKRKAKKYFNVDHALQKVSLICCTLQNAAFFVTLIHFSTLWETSLGYLALPGMIQNRY